MNIVRPNAFCEALFAPQSKGFRYGKILYTEDAGGSSPSSPTIFFNNLAGNYEFTARFIEPLNHIQYKIKRAGNSAPTPFQP